MQTFVDARPQLIDVWRAQGLDCTQEPESVVAQFSNDMTCDGGSAVAAWLGALADSPNLSYQDFLAHCQWLVGDAPRETLSLAWIVPMLWGGLVRGTRGLAPLITQLLTDRAADEGYERLVRLAALNGDAAHFDLVRAHAEFHPENGLATLALVGDGMAATFILEQLKNVRTQESAAQAWRWLTGRPLPRRPRLMATAAADRAGDAPVNDEDTIPDADAAQTWWDQQRPKWEAGQRYALGEPINTSNLARLARHWTGPAGRDLLDLLALKRGRPLGIAPGLWEPDRQRMLVGG